MRYAIRDAVATTLGFLNTNNLRRISFPYYHSVLESEIKGFSIHLKWYRNNGDVISIKDYYNNLDSILNDKTSRYFVMSFDDGLSSVIDNAVDIASDHQANFTVYLICDKIHGDSNQRSKEFLHEDMIIKDEFANSRDIEELIRMGFDIGSHTISHRRVMHNADWMNEISLSKKILEAKFNYQISSFAFPWGRFNKDYTVEQLQFALGIYDQVCITNRPWNKKRFNNRIVRRDNILPNWSTNQLKLFLSE